MDETFGSRDEGGGGGFGFSSEIVRTGPGADGRKGEEIRRSAFEMSTRRMENPELSRAVASRDARYGNIY